MNEIYKDINGFEGLYQVSNFGNVKSLMREYSCKEIILKQGRSTKGYLTANLYKNKKHKSYNVHRLVAIAFIPNTENKPEINHKNGIKSDNRVENLEWCNGSENRFHAYELGLKKPPMKGRYGIDNPKSKQVTQFSTNGVFVNVFYSLAEAERITGINKNGICRVCNKKQKTSGGYFWSY